MRCERSTLAGVSLTDRNGVYSSENICSTPLPSWDGGRASGRETNIPTPTIWRQLRKWPPIYPSMRGLLGSSQEEILKISEEVYWGYELATSELPCWQQVEYMAELHAQLSWHVTRASLRDIAVVARSTSQSRRCSCHCWESLVKSPSAETRRGQMATWLWESSSDKWCRSQNQCSQSRWRSSQHWSKSQWHQSSLSWDAHSGRYISPSPRPPCQQPTDKWLNCSLSELHPHPWQWESMSRMWTGSTSMHTPGYPCSQPRLVAECLPLGLAQTQVWFHLTDDLGNTPSLLTDLASFLGEDVTDEQINAPCPLNCKFSKATPQWW